MKTSITAFTKEQTQITNEDLEDFKIFSGKNAGICYMKDDYYDSNVVNPEKALARFSTVAKTNHHSIADHVKVTVLFENVSKIMAILLNNLQDYSTSEKSGRYTIMTGNSPLEKAMYDKWKDLFINRIKENNPKVDDMTAEKLANENARYVLSVFTRSTTMSYTTSIRQWNYIIDWCDRFINNHKTAFLCGKVWSAFDNELCLEVHELKEQLLSRNLFIPELVESKDRYFSLIINHIDPLQEISIEDCGKDQYGDAYRVSYAGTFVQLAQAQRHRTLRYEIIFDGNPKFFYVPPVIFGTELHDEWLHDLAELTTVAGIVPQATMVIIIESGHVDNFLLKCQERLCGRAQLEIMEQTAATLQKISDVKRAYDENAISHSHNPFSKIIRSKLEKFVGEDGRPLTKCKLVSGGCKEPCRHGAALALYRNI